MLDAMELDLEFLRKLHIHFSEGADANLHSPMVSEVFSSLHTLLGICYVYTF